VRLREHVLVEAEPEDLVEISFVVRDRAGRPVTGLEKDDFLLRVDGADTPLEIVAGATEAREAPLSIAFLMDVSGSMGRAERSRFLAGFRALLARLRPIDELVLVTFTDEPKVQNDFTNDTAVLSAALEATPEPQGGTNLWRALEEAIERLSARAGHGVVVLYSDGQTPAAETPLTAEPYSNEILDRTHRRAIPLYWIVPHFQGIGAVQRNDGLRNLVSTSGGQWILETRGIESALDDVGEDLSARYDASFYVDKAKHAGRVYEIDLRTRASGFNVRAPSSVAGSGSLLRRLEQMLSGEKREERSAAATQLRKYGYARAFPPLLRSYRRESDPGVRDAVVEAMLSLAREEWSVIREGAGDAGDRRRRIERELRSLSDPRASELLHLLQGQR
jgi:VWFA-related protein